MLEWLTQYARPDLDWAYALTTLLFRFFAVFFVLGAIQIGLQLASYFVRRIEAQPASAPAAGGAAPSAGAPRDASAPAAKVNARTAAAIALALEAPRAADGRAVAAIAAALELEQRPARPAAPTSVGTSAWAAAGRAHQHRARPR